jgi:hypothetical protein
VDAVVNVTPSGFVTFNYDTFSVSAQIPGYTGFDANMAVFAARTGGAAEDCWLDDVCLNDVELGPASVTVSPSSIIVGECTSVTFTSVTAGSPCLAFQWKKNGVNIPGANGPTYTTPPLRCPADNGAVFTLAVSNDFSGAVSSGTVNLDCDTTAPTILSVGSLSGSCIGVCFSECVTPASATNAANYSINGGAAGANIASITLRPGGTSVQICLTTPVSGLFSVSATGIADCCAGNTGNSGPVAGFVMGLLNQDIGAAGDPAPVGDSFTCDGNIADGMDIDVRGGGSDLWGTDDHFQYAYTTRCGDFDLQVKVTRLDFQNTWSKAGLVARVTLDANSPNIDLYFTPAAGANGIESGARTTFGGGTGSWGLGGADCSGAGCNINDTPWLRLKRTGNEFFGYQAPDVGGAPGAWVLRGDTGIVPGVPGKLFVGVGVTSHNNGVLAEGDFRKLSISAQAAGGPLSIVNNGNGTVTITFAPDCVQLQYTDTLNSNPNLTSWTSIGSVGGVATVPDDQAHRFFRTVYPTP